MTDHDDLHDLLGPDDAGLQEALGVVVDRLTVEPDELTAARHLRAMARARRAAVAARLARRGVASVAAAAAVTIGLASVGALPDSAQRVVAEAVRTVGWNIIPHPADDLTPDLPEAVPDELPPLPDEADDRAREVRPQAPGPYIAPPPAGTPTDTPRPEDTPPADTAGHERRPTEPGPGLRPDPSQGPGDQEDAGPRPRPNPPSQHGPPSQPGPPQGSDTDRDDDQSGAAEMQPAPHDGRSSFSMTGTPVRPSVIPRLRTERYPHRSAIARPHGDGDADDNDG